MRSNKSRHRPLQEKKSLEIKQSEIDRFVRSLGARVNITTDCLLKIKQKRQEK